MNVVRKTHDESHGVLYVAPRTKVVLFQPEGVMCFSLQGLDHEAFTTDEDSYYEL
ncbi:MAG: hypothetical protein J6A91_08580 [Bacteroidales bacterium]|nr:hypothetical protein [Bacteroidales bacterium]MBP3663494.1 hypothetical protein [Bacteroidales bacterium]